MKYYPLIRGRQYDLLALNELVQANTLSRQIVPIIEPIKDTTGHVRTAAAFSRSQRELFLIQNPRVGAYGLLAAPLHTAALSATVHPARYFDAQPAPLVLALTPQQAAVLSEPQLAVVRNEARIRRLGHKRAIYLSDTFPMREQTADYYTVQDELVQYPLTTLSGAGWADYPLSTSHYDEHGFPQRAIALHLLYEHNGALWVHHFVSVNNPDYTNPGAKFQEALTVLPAWLTQHPAAVTSATDTLLKLQASGHFPGLGTVRKLELMHWLTVTGRWLDAK